MIGTAGPVIVDGGLATELEASGHDLSDRLWSARLLLTDPGAIEAVHLAYYRSGAQVATTASYQATVPGFVEAGLAVTLVWAGLPAAQATLAVLAYRMVSYWLPLIAGIAAAVVYRRRYATA